MDLTMNFLSPVCRHTPQSGFWIQKAQKYSGKGSIKTIGTEAVVSPENTNMSWFCQMETSFTALLSWYGERQIPLREGRQEKVEKNLGNNTCVSG